MSQNFFGRFLVETGIITEDVLRGALKYQRGTNRRLGDLAVTKGYMSEAQAQEVFQIQKEEDLPFGKIALEKKLIKKRQLEDLLFTQTVNSVYLGQALLHQGHISSDQLCVLLGEFCEHETSRRRNVKYLMEGHKENTVLTAFVEAVEKALFRLTGQEAKLDDVTEDAVVDDVRAGATLHMDFKDGGEVSGVVYFPEPAARAMAVVGGGKGNGLPQRACLKGCREMFSVVRKYLLGALEDRGLPVRKSAIRTLWGSEAATAPSPRGVDLCFQAPDGPVWARLAYLPAQGSPAK